jgi:hypothetical protein
MVAAATPEKVGQFVSWKIKNNVHNLLFWAAVVVGPMRWHSYMLREIP